MTVKKAWGAFVIGLIILVVSLFIETNRIRKEEEMRIMNVPVEVTDAQYYALESMPLRDAQKESELIASAAITSAANQRMHEIATKYDPMPRTNSFVNAEVADVEAAVLLGDKLTKAKGVNYGPSGKETWYDLEMSGVIDIMRHHGFDETRYPYWVRDDGVKMFGDYVMVAADTSKLPKGTIIDTSLGPAMCVDHCAAGNIDVAVTWGN